MNFYRFEVEWYSVFDNGVQIEKGFLKAENYADAAGQIENSFKDDLISIKTLYAMEMNDLLYDSDIKELYKGE
jgi:hypothetical protein